MTLVSNTSQTPSLAIRHRDPLTLIFKQIGSFRLVFFYTQWGNMELRSKHGWDGEWEFIVPECRSVGLRSADRGIVLASLKPSVLFLLDKVLCCPHLDIQKRWISCFNAFRFKYHNVKARILIEHVLVIRSVISECRGCKQIKSINWTENVIPGSLWDIWSCSLSRRYRYPPSANPDACWSVLPAGSAKPEESLH